MPGLCQYDTSCGARFAWGHWDLGFGSGQIPAHNSIIVMDEWSGVSTGHMGKVVSASRKSDGNYELVVNESNWDKDLKMDCGVTYTYYSDDHEVTRAGGSSRYPVLGFIYGSQFPVKFTDTNTVYLYSNNQLWPIANEFVYAYLGFRSDNCSAPTPDWTKVIEVSASKRGDFTIRSEVIGVGGLPPDRKISYRITTVDCYSVALDSTKLYALTTENGQTKFNHIVDWNTYVALGYSENSTGIVDISYDLFEYYGEGDPIDSGNVSFWISGASGFAGDYEELEFPDLTPVVYEPSNLRFSDLTPVSVILLWDKGLNADDAGFTWGVYQGSTKIQTVSARTYTVTGLSPNTAYTFKIMTIDGTEESGFSNVLSLTTPSEVTTYPVDFNFVEKYSSEYVEPFSSAANSNNDPLHQSVYCRGGSNPTVFVRLNQVTIPGALLAIWRWYKPSGELYSEESDEFWLDYGSEWWFYQDVDLSNSTDYGTWSVQVVLDGNDYGRVYFEFAPCLSPPSNVVSSNLTSSSLQVNWDVATYATGYNIAKKQGDGWISGGNITTLYFNESGLEPDTTYTYRIFSTAGNYVSENYTVITVTTAVQTGPSAPQNLQIVDP